MKKTFFLLAAVLFAGSLMAVETATYVFTSKSWAATLNDAAANWTSGQDGANFINNGVQVTTAATGANATSPVSFDNVKQIVVTYNTNKSTGAGTLDIKIGNNDAVSMPWAHGEGNGTNAFYTVSFDYDVPQSGAVKITANTTTNSIYVVSIAITYNYNAAAPDILADNIDLGTSLITLSDDGYAKDTSLAVTGANLTAPIAVSFIGTHLSATESELPAAGGTLHLHVASEEAVQLADTVVLTSGETVAKVPVMAKIKQQIALPGAPAVMTGVTKATDATIDGIAGIKVGTGDTDGSLTITVPPYTEKLRFYAAAWAGAAGTISLTAPDGIGLSATELTLLADAGITQNPPFTLAALTPTPFLQEITLTGVTAETVITLSSGTARRFAVWDAKYVLSLVPADFTVNYLNKAGSAIYSETVTFNLPKAPVIEGFTFLYWKALEGNVNEGINLQAVYQASVPTETPAVVVNPANPSQKLIRDGNVYILHDGVQYNLLGTRVR